MNYQKQLRIKYPNNNYDRTNKIQKKSFYYKKMKIRYKIYTE